MAYPYITSAQLSDRISAAALRRIYDDDLDGTADPAPVAQLIADACSKVAGYLQGVYSLDAVAAAPPHEVIRLSLDVAVAMVAIRHPEVLPHHDGLELMKAADRDLAALRKNAVSLDTDVSPNPQSNTGGEIFPDPSTEDVYTFARDGWQDY